MQGTYSDASSSVMRSGGSLKNTAWVRRGTLAVWDLCCWSLALAVVVGVRLDFQINEVQWLSVGIYWLLAVSLVVAFGYLTKFYRGRFRVGSFDEAMGLALLFGGVGVVTLIARMVFIPDLPRSLPILVPPVALIGAAMGRWCFRLWRERLGSYGPVTVKNTLIYGAGDAGYQILRLLRADRAPQYRVVGFVDDSPSKRHLRLHGVTVLGNGESLPEVAKLVDAEVVILAITSATGEFVGRVHDLAQKAALEVLVLPPFSEMIAGRVELKSIRQVEIDDVLGRHPVSTQTAEIADYLMGKRVLITGAGGSIGSELARQVHSFGPTSLVLLDRDESALHAVQLSIYGHGLLDAPDTVLSDIRDFSAMQKIFEQHRPEIIFHAAALKHLTLLERFPEEGWKTNVHGTLNVLQLASEYGVDHFVNVSTDKAADATSVLGSTKRLAERLTSWHAEATDKSFISVRFGNVLGSRGSVLLTFNAQIENGGPVTVTHPDVTRYFMTIREACELVIQAGAMGQHGEVLVLDMGKPVRIMDVAERLISQSGKDIKIVFTGLRDGEKLHENLFSNAETPAGTRHPLIRRVHVPRLNPLELNDMNLTQVEH